jgi:hypothetical protein
MMLANWASWQHQTALSSRDIGLTVIRNVARTASSSGRYQHVSLS